MSIRKINNSEYKNLLISNLPTRPNASPSNFGGGGLSANQMKKAYDATPLFIIARFNELIDYINGTGDARLADDILNAIKGVLASNVETGIEGIATLSDLFASVESGDLAKAIRVSDGKSLDDTLKTIGEETITEVERILAEYEAEKLSPIVEQAEILQESVSSAQSRLSRVEKQVENLNAGLNLPIIEDTDVAYTKTVPENVFSSAMITKVGGMSHKSKNLLDMSNCVRTADTTMVIGEGTLTVTGYIVQNTITHLIGGKTYTFKANSTRTSETEGGGVSIECYDSDSTKLYETYRQHTLNPNVTFEVPSGTVRTRFYFYGGTQNATTSATYTDVMLNEGSTALPYSPYFEGLRHAKVTEIKSIGKNHAVSTESTTSTERGVTITRNIGKSYAVLNGTATADSATRLFGNFKLPVGTYTASVLGLNSTDRLYVGKTADGGVVANYIQTNSQKTFTLTEETECFVQIVWGSGSVYNNTEIKVQIEHGNKATEYKPYTESSLPIPSAVRALDGYGLGVSATAYNFIDWEDKKYYKFVAVAVLNGSESWSEYTSNMHTTYFNKIAKKDRIPIHTSDYYMRIGWGEKAAYVETKGAFTVDAWKAHLAKNPITVVYELATPEVTDISHLLPDDNFIRVEGGGTITAVNEFGLAAPTEIIYQTEV